MRNITTGKLVSLLDSCRADEGGRIAVLVAARKQVASCSHALRAHTFLTPLAPPGHTLHPRVRRHDSGLRKSAVGHVTAPRASSFTIVRLRVVAAGIYAFSGEKAPRALLLCF